MDDVNKLWSAYERYKHTAEQHEFAKIIALDLWLVPAYNDLQKNYTKEHKDIFVRNMIKVLNHFGIRIDDI